MRQNNAEEGPRDTGAGTSCVRCMGAVDVIELASMRWPRLWAKLIDLALGMSLLSTASYLSGARFGGLEQLLMTLTVSFPLAVIMEAVMQAAVGTTPGRWLFGLRLAMADGTRPPATLVLKRSLWLWGQGLVFGIPGPMFIGMFCQSRRLLRGEEATYDLRWRTRVVRIGTSATENQALSFTRRAGAITLAGASALVIATNYVRVPEAFWTGTWVNPHTGKSVELPYGWKAMPSVSESGSAFTHFTSRDDSEGLILAASEGNWRSLPEYLGYFLMSSGGDFQFQPGSFCPGDSCWSATGTLRGDRNVSSLATIAKADGRYWRIIAISAGKRAHSPGLLAIRRDVLESIEDGLPKKLLSAQRR